MQFIITMAIGNFDPFVHCKYPIVRLHFKPYSYPQLQDICLRIQDPNRRRRDTSSALHKNDGTRTEDTASLRAVLQWWLPTISLHSRHPDVIAAAARRLLFLSQTRGVTDKSALRAEITAMFERGMALMSNPSTPEQPSFPSSANGTHHSHSITDDN